MVGGGTGGHVTPLLALGRRLKEQHPEWQLHYLGARRDVLGASLSDQFQDFDSRHFILAGKWHRFGRVRKRQFFYVWRSDFWLNFYNLIMAQIGLIQSWLYLRRLRPDLIFSKGGYVAFGPCLIARLLKIPLVIHDSDVVPGLAHSLVQKQAVLCLTGFASRGKRRNVRHVGIPVNPLLGKRLSPEAKAALWEKYQLPPRAQVILVTGGGGGAQRLNLAVLQIFDDLKLKKNTYLIVAAGRQYYQEALTARERLKHKQRVQIHDFIYDMPDLLRASLGVVTRAGATILAEISLAGKAAIIVPNALLPRGHQAHNARLYQRAGAAWLVSDDGQQVNIRALKQALNELITKRAKRLQLERAIKKLAVADATAQTLVAVEDALRTIQAAPYQQYQAQQQAKQARQAERRPIDWPRLGRHLFFYLQYTVALGLLAIVIYKVAYVGEVQIQFKEASDLVSVEQRRALQQTVDDFFYGQQSWHQRHFYPNSGLLTAQLLEQDYVQTVSLHRDLRNSRLVLTITPRQVLGRALTTDQQLMLVTTDGYAISGYDDLLYRSNYSLTIAVSQPASAERQLVLSPLDLRFISQVNLYLGSKGYKLHQVSLSANPSEIIFYIKGYDFQVIALKTRNPIKQAISLAIALDFFAQPHLRSDLLTREGLVMEAEDLEAEEVILEAIVPEEYVDVRLINRVVYK